MNASQLPKGFELDEQELAKIIAKDQVLKSFAEKIEAENKRMDAKRAKKDDEIQKVVDEQLRPATLAAGEARQKVAQIRGMITRMKRKKVRGAGRLYLFKRCIAKRKRYLKNREIERLVAQWKHKMRKENKLTYYVSRG